MGIAADDGPASNRAGPAAVPLRPRAPTITVDANADSESGHEQAAPAAVPASHNSQGIQGASCGPLCTPSRLLQSHGTLAPVDDAPRQSRQPATSCDRTSPFLGATQQPESRSVYLEIPGLRPRAASLEFGASSPSFCDEDGSTIMPSLSAADSRVTLLDHENRIAAPNADAHGDAALQSDGPFTLSPNALAEMIGSKSLAEFQALGGLAGIACSLHTDCSTGLSVDEALGSGGEPSSKLHADRVAIFGTNRLPDRKTRNILELMLLALSDKVLIILSVVAAISLSVGLYQSLWQPHAPGEPRVEWVDGFSIMIAVMIVVVAGALNDYQKEQQFARLNKKRDDRTVKVTRSGKPMELNVFDILAGDVLHLSPGDILTADGVLIAGHNIRCDESSITGESHLLKKIGGEEALKMLHSGHNAEDLDPFIISGSKISEGLGTYLVTGVGVNSVYGRLRQSLKERTEATPLQKKLSAVADRIASAGVAVAVLLFLVLTIKFLTSLPSSNESPFDRLQTFLRIFIVSIAVVVIAVPEGLPLAVTLALAISVTRMLKDNNLVRILSACETMGNATTVCCDKTGTLTTNKMTITCGMIGATHQFTDTESTKDDQPPSRPENSTSQVPSNESAAAPDTVADVTPTGKFVSGLSLESRRLLVDSIAINTTAFEGNEDGRPTFIGSKTEAALLSFAKERLGMRPVNEERANAEVVEIFPFNSLRKCMATVTKLPRGRFRMFLKGAPELLLEKSTLVIGDPFHSDAEVILTQEGIDALTNAVRSYTEGSLRTLGLAYRDFTTWPPAQSNSDHEEPEDEVSFDDVFADLTFVGVVAMKDPLRPGVSDAVAQCQHAGVEVRMVTGDNVDTARAIARECGILTDEGIVMEGQQFRRLPTAEMDKVIPRLQVLARSSPDDKMLLVKRLKELGETVAVTGDGTNDGPALRAADVGFSMASGTEVSKEASSIVLMDDNFSSIVRAIEWGRSVNDVIKRFLHFQLTVNVTAVTITFVSAISSETEKSILTPVQLLWVNLIMDTFAALALATDPPNPSVLDRKPERKSASLISSTGWKMIIGQSIFQLIVCLTLDFSGNDILGYKTKEEKETLETLVFNTFVWMQFFNLTNNRRLDNKLNIFEGILRNPYFIAVNLVIIIGQCSIIFFGGSALSATTLTPKQWAISLVLGFMSIPVGVIVRLIPDDVMYRVLPLRVDHTLSPRIDDASRPGDGDGVHAWNESIENVRSGLVAFHRESRSSRVKRLRLTLPSVSDLFSFVSGATERSVEDPVDDLERQPLLQRSNSDRFRSRPGSALAPAAVMVGIVGGSIAGWPSSRDTSPTNA